MAMIILEFSITTKIQIKLIFVKQCSKDKGEDEKGYS
jgi:hypothetical protein